MKETNKYWEMAEPMRAPRSVEECMAKQDCLPQPEEMCDDEEMCDEGDEANQPIPFSRRKELMHLAEKTANMVADQIDKHEMLIFRMFFNILLDGERGNR